MRCITDQVKASKPKLNSAQGRLSPVSTAPVAALVPVLLAALGAAATAAPSSTFDTKVWAQAVVDALLNRMISRVPLDGQQCPFSGLNRAQIYELLKSGADGQPEIESFTLAKPGEASGARFFFVGSALEYLRRRADAQREMDLKHNRKTKKNHGKHP